MTVTSITDSTPWHRMPGETEQAYEAFMVFLDHGLGRTVAAVGRALGKSGNLVDRWCQKHRWRERASTYDAAQLFARDEELAAIRRELLGKHRRGASALFALAVSRMVPIPLLARDGTPVLDEEGQVVLVPPSPSELNAAAFTLDRAIRHERLAAGLPTDVKQQDLLVRETFAEMERIQAEILAIIEGSLCDDCRDRIADRLDDIAQQRKGVSASVF